MPADRPARIRELACGGCGDRFEAPVRPGPAPALCPWCRQIRKQENDRRRYEEARARKLAALPETVACRRCGRPVEGYRPGRRGGVPKYCREHARERRLERNRRSAAESYQRRKRRAGLNRSRRPAGIRAPTGNSRHPLPARTPPGIRRQSL